MDQIRFARMLCDRMSPSSDTGHRHIIQFKNRHDYEHCLFQLQHLQKPELSSSVQALPIIYALSCNLSTSDLPDLTQNQIHIEKDYKLHIDKKMTTNPIVNRSTLLPFLPKNKIPWGVKKLMAHQAWKLSKGKHVRIGVIDTGADYSHPDLHDSLGRGLNMLNRFSPPYDDNGHGTHIAGTIAANNSSDGITGVAPGAIVHPVKAFDHQGSAYVSDIIMGINWCVSSRMNIINMSFGMKKNSDMLRDAIRYATRSGIIVVASAGNDGKSNLIDYPAMYAQTIAVGATNKKNIIMNFSNKGKYVDTFAPGEKIYSTWLGNKYAELSGTSMATSHISGIVALMLSLRPELTHMQIKKLLHASSQINSGIIHVDHLIKGLMQSKSS